MTNELGYLVDQAGYFTGARCPLTSAASLGVGWRVIPATPPQTEPGQYLIWTGDGWQITDVPRPDIQTVEPTVELTRQSKITKLAFLSRFTDEEAITLDLASQGSTVEAATLRRYMAKVNAATFIDLSREDTRAGVLALETMGILAEGRALEILDSPILSSEVPR